MSLECQTDQVGLLLQVGPEFQKILDFLVSLKDQLDLVVQLDLGVPHLLLVHLNQGIQEFLDFLWDLERLLVQGYPLHQGHLVIQDRPVVQHHQLVLKAQEVLVAQLALEFLEILSVLKSQVCPLALVVLATLRRQYLLIHHLDPLSQKAQPVQYPRVAH